MMITTKTTVSFHLPDEYTLSEKFKTQHSDWIESCTSQWMGYTKQETYAVDVQKEAQK